MSECIGYCEEKVGPLYQHPEYSGDRLCGECLLMWWEEDFERYVGEMKDSILEIGAAKSDLLLRLEEGDFV